MIFLIAGINQSNFEVTYKILNELGNALQRQLSYHTRFIIIDRKWYI